MNKEGLKIIRWVVASVQTINPRIAIPLYVWFDSTLTLSYQSIVIQLFFPFCTHFHFHFISFRVTTLVLKWNNLTSSTTYGEGEVLAVVFKFIGQNWPLVSHLFTYCTPRLESRAGVSSTVRRRLKTRDAEVTVLKIHIERYIRILESEFLSLESGIQSFGIRILVQGLPESR